MSGTQQQENDDPIGPKWASTEQDWAAQRGLIKRLYLEEDKTLSEVMAILRRDHNFKGTVKMYKNRITKWGLDKRNKEVEIKAIVRKKTVRAAIGKSTEFRLRGHTVDMKDVERYLKRKLFKDEDILPPKEASSAPTPPWLECLTPTLSPSSPRSPEVFEVPENIFMNIRNYILGSLGAGTWTSASDASDCISAKEKGNDMIALKALYSHHDVACHLLDAHRFEEAGRTLVIASSLIHPILQAEHPRTIGCVFDLIMYLRKRRRPEIGLILLRQCTALAGILLPCSHPLARVCKLLAGIDPLHFEHVLITAWQSALDCFEAALGPMHYSTLRSRLEYIQTVESLYGLSRAELLLRKLVHSCTASCGLSDVRTLKLLDTLAEILIDQQKYAEADEVARQLVDAARLVQPRAKAVDLEVAGLFVLARVQQQRGDTEMAEATLRRAIMINATQWGWGHALTGKYLLLLEEWLTAWGREGLAGQIREQRLQGLSDVETCGVAV